MISSTDLLEILEKEQIEEQVSMKLHTTFQAGGKADFLVSPKNEQELSALFRLLKEKETPSFILGRGSNLLVSDRGYHGVLISLKKYFSYIKREESDYVVGAGTYFSRICESALQDGLSGLEFASGIPGSLGGGLYMNAGAYGSSLEDVVKEATVLKEDGTLEVIPASSMNLSYRHSVFMEQKLCILSARLSLTPASRILIKCRMEDLNQKRREKQPLNFPSAGSTFKRPEGHYAGALIEEAGLKGFSLGRARVSEKHAGFIVNTGEASASEIYELILYVQKRVQEKTGILLEPEVGLLGEF